MKADYTNDIVVPIIGVAIQPAAYMVANAPPAAGPAAATPNSAPVAGASTTPPITAPITTKAKQKIMISN